MKFSDTIIKKLMSVPYKEVEVGTRGFDCPDTAMKNHLEQIGTSFLTGYHHAIGAPLNHQYDLGDKMYSGFVIEGAAMGCMLRDLLFWKKAKYTLALLEHYPDHIYMIHVGIGWALARMPVVNLPKQMRRFDPLVRDLILDGFGFHQAYFKTSKYVGARKLPKQIKGDMCPPFYQGIGRALWFVFGGQPKRIAGCISTFDQRFQPDLWAGIGLAMAYAGGAPAEQLNELRSLGSTYKAELAQGVSFACRARLKASNMLPHTQEASLLFCRMPTEKAAAITKRTEDQVRQSNTTDQLYASWRNSIIAEFENHFSYENAKV